MENLERVDFIGKIVKIIDDRNNNELSSDLIVKRYCIHIKNKFTILNEVQKKCRRKFKGCF